MGGVIDIVTQIELFSPKARGNKLIELVVEDLPNDPPEEFEVIVDYKGMKRPEDAGVDKKMLQIYDWQVYTYAHLRSTLKTKPIIAGVLIYLNELVPTKTDPYDLRRAVKEKLKGIIVPEPGSEDEETLLKWKGANKDEQPPILSIDFRLTRTIRVVPIDDTSKKQSLKAFDNTVGRIEQCIAKESRSRIGTRGCDLRRTSDTHLAITGSRMAT